MGSLGAAAATFGLPPLVYLLTFACNDISGCPAPSLLSPKTLDLERLKQEVGWPEDGVWGFASWEATGYVLAKGVELSSGGRLKYKCNGMRPKPSHKRIQ